MDLHANEQYLWIIVILKHGRKGRQYMDAREDNLCTRNEIDKIHGSYILTIALYYQLKHGLGKYQISKLW